MSLGGFGATKRCWLEKRQKQVTDRYMDQFLMGVEKFKNWIVLTEKNNDEEQRNQKKTDNAHSP